MDPLKKVLRSRELPVSILERWEHHEMLMADERTFDFSRGFSCTRAWSWRTDGVVYEFNSEELEEATANWGGGGRCDLEIVGASCAVRYDTGRDMGGSLWHAPTQVIVWPGCTPAALEKLLNRR